MRGDVVLSTATILGFVLVLARISGIFVFVPLPGLGNGSQFARIALALSITVSLFPYWPHLAAEPSVGLFLVWLLSEAALGIGIGLAIAFVTESFSVAAQIMGLQAGYAYASTVDPNTQADSTVLVVFAQLAAGLLFFAMGLDREVIRIFAASLQTAPPGAFTLSRSAGQQVLTLGASMFSTGMRLAFPVVAVLLLIDISLALLGRINSQLQLLTIAFPVKMAVGLAIFGWLLLLAPALVRAGASSALSVSRLLVTH